MIGICRKMLFGLALLVAGAGVHAQTSSAEFADCRGEITDPDVQLRMDLCSAHVGCKLVLKISKTCIAVRGFLDRLGQKIEKTSDSLMGSLFGRKEIPADAIWEAALTDNTRSIASNPDVQARDKAIRDGLASAPSTWRSGRNAAGSEYAAIGAVNKDGTSAEGWGMAVFSTGSIYRGQYANGELNGQGDHVVLGADGSARHSGEYTLGRVAGKGVRVTAQGTSSEGEFLGGELYRGTRRAADGSMEKGSFDLKTQQLTSGERLGADGALLEKGTFRDGQLYLGERYVDGQLKERVDGAAAERAAAEAKQRAVLDAQAKARADAQAKERDFRASLGTMNVGQLYALADELKSNGDANKSREVLRALVSRFPDHALGAQAVQQLQALAAPPKPPAPSSMATGVLQSAGGMAMGFEDCKRRAESHSDLERALNSVPRNDTVMLLRASVAVLNVMIKDYERCLPDERASGEITNLTRSRDGALATCRSIAATDNCAQSPFGAGAEAAARQQEAQQAAAQRAAQEKAEHDRAELRDALNQLSDAVNQAISARSGKKSAVTPGACSNGRPPPPGGVCTAN